MKDYDDAMFGWVILSLCIGVHFGAEYGWGFLGIGFITFNILENYFNKD